MPLHEPSGALRCVLLVEDNPGHAALMGRAFTEAGVGVLCAGSLQEARTLLAERAGPSPELIVVDLGLPDGTGLELLSPGLSMPVLVLTAQGDERSAVEAMRRGAMDYLVKTHTTLTRLPGSAAHAWAEWNSRAARLAAEQARAASEARLSQVLDAAPQAILSLDPAGHITQLNQAAAATFGCDPAASRGAPIEAMFCPQTGPRLRQLLSRLGRGTEDTLRITAEDGFRGRRASGVLLPVELSLVRVTVGRETTYTLILDDITDRLRREEQRRQAQKLQALGQLTGGIAHDFNNLLMVIRGNLELLADPSTIAPERVELVRDALASTERGAALTRRLLGFARRQPLAPRVVDVNDTVQGMLGMLQRTFGSRITVSHRLSVPHAPCLVDSSALENALLNICLNARDAMPGGGSLHIDSCALHGVADNPLQGPALQLTITDSGTGMPTEVQEQIFDPFFTTKAPGEGTGLGMSMIYGFVQQSGGHISIASTPGEGTAVSLFLPLITEHSPARLEPPPPEPLRSSGHRSARLLVVDDDPAVLRLTRTRLQRMGYRVVAVPSAHDALAALSAGAASGFSLMLTDIMLAGASGIDLAQQAAQLCPDLPIVLTSGVPDAARGAPERARFLPKPYTTEQLTRVLRSALEEGRPPS